MRLLTIVLAGLLIPLRIDAQYIPKPMVPLRLVNDYTGLLSMEHQIALNDKLLAFNNETTTQIFVITYDSLQGYDIGDYAVRLANNDDWRIGQEGRNNGILVLVSPANHKMTIQTGYGLEGAVPDAICARLINTVLTPHFKTGDYYAGLDSATNVLMSLTRGEFTAQDYLNKKGESAPAIVVLLMVLFFIVFMISSARRRIYSPKHAIPWWLLMGTGGSRNSGWGSFTSGSGSFGGGGGGFGGFGGGGGGSFGGGGASGGW